MKTTILNRRRSSCLPEEVTAATICFPFSIEVKNEILYINIFTKKVTDDC